jgi:Zn-finger nucleic acid-binding protein
MKCPVCNLDLVMTERQMVEIDYCTKCRGIWLDRGKLDKIIERSTSEMPQGQSRASNLEHHGEQHKDEQHYKKKKGFLSDLFD